MSKNYTDSNIGQNYIMDLPHSMYAVQLTSLPAILGEARNLNIYFKEKDIDSLSDASTKVYSIRAHDGLPYVMLYTQNDAVQWCRGFKRRRPSNYMRQIVTFIAQQNLDIASDMACTGIIRQKGRYYNVYDLPNNFTYYGNMDLSYAGLTNLPDMSTTIIMGNYNISGNPLLSYAGVPRAVYGNFYTYQKPNQRTGHTRPRNCKIHGVFYTGCISR